VKDEPRDIGPVTREAERAADKWIGPYLWTQQAGIPNDMNRILRAIWIHGYVAGREAQTVRESR
jgi:hypothetical protein